MFGLCSGQVLGSTSLVADAEGNKLAENRYYPYGEERLGSGTLPTDYRFTGQRKEQSLGIYAMGARWYDPSLNRWLSADTLVPDSNDPPSFNRYSWVRNNPLIYVDPTGHKEDGECGLNGEECHDDPPPVDEVIVKILQGMVDAINDPARTVPIIIPLKDGTNLVIMPVGADPLQERPEWFEPIAGFFAGAGAFMDFVEVVFALPGAGAGPGLIDIRLAGAADLFSGDTWVAGKPHPDLPPMFLAGQDVLWTAGVDYAGPLAGSAVGAAVSGNPAGAAVGYNVTDFITSSLSVIYDWDRAMGRRTSINTGMSIQGDYYILYYPSGE
jgi:RHS repeat-associated protein